MKLPSFSRRHMLHAGGFGLAAAGIAGVPLGPVRAQTVVDVTGGARFAPITIAVPSFASSGGGQEAAQMAAVIANDLQNSSRFNVLAAGAAPQSPEQLQGGVQFDLWRPLGIRALVTGQVLVEPDGRLRVEFRLWDIGGGQQTVGMAYTTVPSGWRRIAHIIADQIYERLTGAGGYFDSRIVYVAQSGSPSRRLKRLAIMDQDGANHRYLTDNSALSLTPRFSPNGTDITFLAFAGEAPRVYLQNIDTGKRELLGNFPGASFAPRFSPDGNRVVFSQSSGANTEIYMADLRTRNAQQLTSNPAIDTAPSFSPDGAQIVFESDRGGSQQIYVMAAAGGGANRISFGEGRYATPVWSPKGDLIAFTKQLGGRFYIGVMAPDGSGERLVAEDFHAEGPTWAPNGQVIAYFKEIGRSARLYQVDIFTGGTRTLDTPGDASDPAWSPLNP